MRALEERTRGRCKVEWIDSGEGQHGKYDPQSKEDVHLLRFRCFAKVEKKWIPVQNGSVLSQVSASENKEMRELLLEKLLDRIEPKVEEALQSGSGAKNGALIIKGGAAFFEKLSWFGPEMAEEY